MQHNQWGFDRLGVLTLAGWLVFGVAFGVLESFLDGAALAAVWLCTGAGLGVALAVIVALATRRRGGFRDRHAQARAVAEGRLPADVVAEAWLPWFQERVKAHRVSAWQSPALFAMFVLFAAQRTFDGGPSALAGLYWIGTVFLGVVAIRAAWYRRARLPALIRLTDELQTIASARAQPVPER